MPNRIDVLFANDLDEEVLKSKKDLIERKCRNLHFYYTSTNSGLLSKVSSGHYDVIFYDLGMDIRESYPILTRIKDLQPGAIIVGTSAHPDAHNQASDLVEIVFIMDISKADQLLDFIGGRGLKLDRK